MRAIAIVFIVFLAGCETAEQRAESDIAEFAPYCEKLGYEKNTDKWRDCIQNQATSLRQSGQYNIPIYCAPSGGMVRCY